ncbi:MAG: type VI secretion system ATPase TssH, partial [Bacteroidota bacterium]
LANVGPEHREDILKTTKEEVFDQLKDNLRPEFLNRIDERIMFLPLTKGEIKQIAMLLMRKTEKMLHRQGMELKLSMRAMDWLAEKGYDPQFGARPMKRVLQSELADALSKDLIAGNFVAGDTIYADLGSNTIVFSKTPFSDEAVSPAVKDDNSATLQSPNEPKPVEEKESNGRRKRRGSKKAVPEAEKTSEEVAELKKATQDLLDAVKDIEGEEE